MSNPCQFLPWDSQFFGVRIARVLPGRLSPGLIERILVWCQEQAIACLYFLADSDHDETVSLAEAHGFHLVDIRLTLQWDARNQQEITTSNGAAVLRPFQAGDLPVLQAIAGDSYHDSRFYFDGHFAPEACDLFYATWIKNSCEGYADQVLVTEQEGQPVGFITCHLPNGQGNPALGQIGLVGVAAQARGSGLGRMLVNGALDWFQQQGISQVQVVTQGRNLAAQRLYQRCGFLTHNVQLWYHKWFK